MTTGEPESVLQNSGEEIATILVAIDSSAGASRIIATAARLSRAVPAAAVHVAHVFKSSATDRARVGAPGIDTHAVEDEKEHLAAHIRSAQRQTRNSVQGHFLVGDPAHEILRLADQLKADLLVVGTHDYTGFERFLLGSIAETLMRKCHCSTLVVRPPRSGK